MKHSSLFSMLFLTGVLLFSSASLPSTAHAMGVSPGIIELTDLSQASSIPKTLRVTRSSKEGNATFDVTVDGPAAKYIKLSTPSVTIKSGELWAEYSILIEPKNAPNGELQALVNFKTSSNGTGGNTSAGNNVSILQGATARIRFSVTDKQVLQFTISNVSASTAETDQAPVFSYKLKNAGNVDARPDKIHGSIVNQLDASDKQEFDIPTDGLNYVAPGLEETISLPLSSALPLGKYDMRLDFYSGGTILHTEEHVRFEIVPSGTLAQKISLNTFKVNPESAVIGQLVKGELTLQNKGTIATKATGYIDVKKEGESVDVLKGDEKMLGVNTEIKISLPWRVTEEGTYELDAYASYGAGDTEHISKTIIVKAKSKTANERPSDATTPVSESAANLFIILAIIAAAIIIVGIIVIVIIKGRHRTPPPTQMPPTPPTPPTQNPIPPTTSQQPPTAGSV